MISRLEQILQLIDSYTDYLSKNGVRINDLGFPLLNRECFLNEWPDVIVPFKERQSRLVIDKKRTALCFYCADAQLYPRLERVLRDIHTYRQYLGVIGMDVTVTRDMDLEWQEETILLNHLFTAVLAVNDVKVAANLRVGSPQSLECLGAIPRGVMCASGTLGCSSTSSPLDMTYSSKLMRVQPSKIILYGRGDQIMEQQIVSLGIPYRRYRDAHTEWKRAYRH